MTAPRPRVTLRQARYTVREVAFLLNVQPRTVRAYMREPSVKHPGRALLVATKPSTIWYIGRDDLKIFLEEKYGPDNSG